MSVVRKQFGFSGINFDFCAIVASDNNVYYKLKDFANLLGYPCTSRACKLIHDKFKFKLDQLSERAVSSERLHPDTTFVSETGVLSLMFRSRTVESFLFNFVFDVVLPAFRKTGENPSVTSSQANCLIEALREQLAEKERLLAETRQLLADRERTLTRSQTSLAEKERMLEETRAALEEKIRALEETQAALEESNKLLASEMKENHQLQSDIQSARSKVAVSPKSVSVCYTLCVYRHENTYKFIRAQKRSLPQARKRIPEQFELVYSMINVPNPFHIVNRLKELLPRCKVKYNTITTDVNVIELLRQCL